MLVVDRIKRHLVGVTQSGQESYYGIKSFFFIIPVFKYQYPSFFIISSVMHIRNKYTAIRTFCKKTRTFQAFNSGTYFIELWNVKTKWKFVFKAYCLFC